MISKKKSASGEDVAFSNSEDAMAFFNSDINSNRIKKITVEFDPDKPDENGIYQNEVDFAEMINNALLENNTVVAQAPMQSGKTNSIRFLCNQLIRNRLKADETIVFLTSMSDTILLIQNQECLQDKKFKIGGKVFKSNIFVLKMTPDFRDKAEKYIEELNVRLLVFDECDYGSGGNSLFNKTFFSRMKAKFYNVQLLLISATPYCAMNAINNGELNAKFVQAKIKDNYFGVSFMIDNNMITDINDYKGNNSKESYDMVTNNKKDLTDNFKDDLNWFLEQKGGGMALIRTGKKNDSIEASTLKRLIEEYTNSAEVIAVGVRNNSIKSVFSSGNYKAMEHGIIHNDKKIILIVVNALSAGKDLGDLKEYVRFVVETRRDAIANGSQGLVGRICGYHKNRNVRIIASIDVLSFHSQIEKNPDLLKQPEFINKAISLGLDFSTQLKKKSKEYSKTEYKSKINGPFSFSNITDKNSELVELFSNPDFGYFEELESTVINQKNARNGSSINTQRSSKYKKNQEIFIQIWNECINNEIDFGSRFHRFRAEGNDENRLRIKRGIIINDKLKKFYIIDRLNDGEKISTNAVVVNKSCYAI